MLRLELVAASALVLLTPLARELGAQTGASPHDSLAVAILAELVGINTAPSGGEMSRANRAMADRLLAAGYPVADVELAGPDAQNQNLVARLRGRDPQAKPIVLMAHIDVVEALRADWSVDPYQLTTRDGYHYGRGTTDNKGGAAVLVANMIRWKREGFVPPRDLILILTTDEETSAQSGIVWLLKNRPALANAEYALNIDAGGLLEREGKAIAFYAQLSEKMYQSYRLEVTNRGGHSSLPRADNAIYALAAGLVRLERFRFPVMYNEVTRTSFARSASLERGRLADDMRAAARGDTSGPAIERLSGDPQLNGNLRTTCVATLLSGGHADNALPQRAAATVNCRIFPGVPAAEVQAMLQRAVADTAIHITPTGTATPSPASPLRRDVMAAVEGAARGIWPGVTTIPVMENGATDGLYVRNLGIPVYGLSGPLFDVSDDRAHGRDERVGVRHFAQVREFWYTLVKSLAAAAAS